MTKRTTDMSKRVTAYQESLEEREQGKQADRFFSIPVSELSPTKWNARKHFSEDEIDRLAEDLRKNGQIHPIVVRKKKDKYEVVVGARRFYAAKKAGLAELKAIERDLNDEDAQRLALSENLNRVDINPFEETIAYFQILWFGLSGLSEFKAFQAPDEEPPSSIPRLLYKYSNEVEAQNNVIPKKGERGKKRQKTSAEQDISIIGGPMEKVILSVFDASSKMTWQSFVKNRLPLLKLPKDVKLALQAGKLDYTKAKVVGSLKDEAERKALLEDVITTGTPLSELKQRVKKLQARSKPLEPKDILYKRANVLSKALRSSKGLDSPAKRKKAERLLAQLEALMGIESPSQD